LNPIGRTALLTGATGGLGRAIASALAHAGASLVVSSRKEAELNELVGGLPGDHRVVVSDLAEPGAAEALAAEAGEVDILVANAALPGTGALDSLSLEEIQRAIRVNLEAPIILTRLLTPAMAARREGSVVLMSSISGRVASDHASMYNATKFGLRGFGLATREDLREHGVGLTLVAPGLVADAGMFADSGAEPPPGLGAVKPEHVASAVLRGVESSPAEIQVASVQQKVLGSFGYHFPRLSAFVQRHDRSGLAAEIAGGQTDKR
jgi:short-subunit dehydrogenase